MGKMEVMEVSDDWLIQNRHEMWNAIQGILPAYEKALACWRFNPNSYTFEAMNEIGHTLEKFGAKHGRR